MLKFKVRGSAAEPYVVSAEGEGATLRMFCTCPAGRKSAMFCKHQRSILLGEVTNLVEPSDDPSVLRQRLDGSGYLDAAMRHVSVQERKPVIEGFETLEQVHSRYSANLAEMGYRCELTRDAEPWATHALHCYAIGKHKKELKYPVVSLVFEESTGDFTMLPDGSTEYVNIRPRTRPWSVTGSRAQTAGNWATLARALPAFLDSVGIVR